VRKNSKRKIAATIAITAILVGGGGAAAIAYWSAGGSGSGTVTTGSANGVTVNQPVPATNLVPGGPTVALSGTFDNTNSGPVHITTVTATISGTNKSGCTAADYALTPASGIVTLTGTATSIPSGSGVGAWSGVTLSMINAATNQDPCKGATVAVSYLAN
jgi:hypothetical protein